MASELMVKGREYTPSEKAPRGCCSNMFHGMLDLIERAAHSCFRWAIDAKF